MADEAFNGDSIYTIENVGAKGKFLNVEDNLRSNGTNVQLMENKREHSVQWRLVQVEAGIYSIENEFAKGKVLSVEDKSQENGANVQLWRNEGEASTQWRLVQKAGLCTFENVAAKGKFLSIEDNNRDDGANVQLGDKPAAPASQWRVAKAGYSMKLTNHKGVLVGFAYSEDKFIEVTHEMSGTLIEKWNFRNKGKEAMGGDLIVEVNGKTELAAMWKEREAEELDMRLVPAPRTHPTVSPMSTPLSIFIPFVAYCGANKYNYDLDALGFRHQTEIAWVVAQVLCLAGLALIFLKIGQMPSGGRKILKQTAQEYDKAKFMTHFTWFALGFVILAGIYAKWQDPLHLALHAVMTLLQLFESPLFKLHIFGKYVKRPFPAWIPMPKFGAKEKDD